MKELLSLITGTLAGIAIIIFFVFIIIKLNEMILEDEALELAHYCSMVKGGHWPDYRKIETASCDIITSESQTQSDKP